MTTIRIRVETRHILAGKPEDCGACPVALAIQEATGDRTVEVGDGLVGGIVWRMRPDGTCEDIACLTHDVTTRIRRYDQLHQMEPFEFDLEWPEG